MIEYGNIRTKCDLHPETRGWFMGEFIPKEDFFHSNNGELKYREYHAGETHIGSTTNERRKTLAILISGKIRFTFSSSDREYILEHPLDYIADDEIPGDHTLEALEDSIVITVRQLHP